jgi:hypothetical protein
VAAAGAPTALSAGVVEGGGAFNELSQGAQETETNPSRTTSSTSSESSSNSKTVILLAMAAAVLLLVAIAFVIARDARKVAPAGDGSLGEPAGRPHSPERLRKRRSKAKAARRQRKRNR